MAACERAPCRGRLPALEEPRLGGERGAGRLAPQSCGSDLNVRVARQSLGLPRLVPCPEEGAIAVEGDAHGRRDRRPVALEGGQQNRLGFSKLKLRHRVVHAGQYMMLAYVAATSPGGRGPAGA